MLKTADKNTQITVLNEIQEELTITSNVTSEQGILETNLQNNSYNDSTSSNVNSAIH